MKQKIEIGDRFGILTVVENVCSSLWICRCDCGRDVVFQANRLRTGNNKSCGCLRSKNMASINRKRSGSKQNTNLKSDRIYRIWKGMKARCYSNGHISYKNYGGRGIKICDEWNENYECFKEWALSNGYRADLTIDRIDTNGFYEPENCRWVTPKDQANHKRNNVVIEYNGESGTVSYWAEKTGLTYSAISCRLKRGWDPERILNTPTRSR